ncbi:recombinase family protein [Phormidium sp. CLA17]|nr:recombinase family protein [Leptolyngbya sp. Cla-17]
MWITGATRSGKTSHLIRQFYQWVAVAQPNAAVPASYTLAAPHTLEPASDLLPSTGLPGILVFAAIGDNRIDLVDRLVAATQSQYSFNSTTPLGFFQDEVTLFWPLLIQQLDLKAQFPLRLNPENEQELAARLWQPEIDRVIGSQAAINEARLVRKILDLLQLAGLAGIPVEDIPLRLQQGLAKQDGELPIPFETVGMMLQQWQQWCLERGLLTYGITAGLYWQYLLEHATYRSHLIQRYSLILADDVDEYPAIARHLFEHLLNAGASAAFTFNPDGAVRLGLGADPTYLAALANQCEIVELSDRPTPSLSDDLGETLVEFAINPLRFLALPESIQAIQTVSRSELLRQTAETIIAAVQSGQVEPRNIAVISPGLDAIARYALIDILTKHQIPVESLNDQRPLISFAIVRALLTLLTLVYPGLGRLVDRDAIAEMLVVLGNRGQILDSRSATSSNPTYPTLAIDPVRAGLLADYCFAPHPERPRLLPATTFPRWDRLGYQTSEAYQAVIQWIETQQSQLEQRLIPNVVSLLDRAIQHFLLGGSSLAFDQLSALRQLIETAQHYWEVADRVRRSNAAVDQGATRQTAPPTVTISQFIQLLRNSTVTANPYPVRPIGAASNAVTLATVFQYRSSRRVHRWQFWFDAASPRWLSGVDALFASPLFLQNWSGGLWTAAHAMDANEQRLRRILLDLQSRTEERIYLCHSDLATSGQEQTGVLLTLVNAATLFTTL